MPETTVPDDDASPGEEPSPGEDTASRADPALAGEPAQDAVLSPDGEAAAVTGPDGEAGPDGEPAPDGEAAAVAAPDEEPAGEGAELGAVDREILALENLQWKYQGAKEMEIRRRLNLSPTHYYQRLNVLIDTRAALEHDPMLVARLRRQRGDHG
ncbi:DUF3263 domain-containing protein [Kocuria arenosa]|uniref:DUF3263 domain-containing protein n=1 Tax=Kocuria arenosa TaxID=3071446 RepID=UPI003F671392